MKITSGSQIPHKLVLRWACVGRFAAPNALRALGADESRARFVAWLLIAVSAVGLWGCSLHPGRRHPFIPPLIQAKPGSSPVDLLVDRQAKAVLGRQASWADITRVATSIRPLLEQIALRPDIARMMAAAAAERGEPSKGFAQRFISKQEADILLESGGDPEAVSPAGAAGVAQWLNSTGRGRGGLKIDVRRSEALTAQIEGCARQIHDLRVAGLGSNASSAGSVVPSLGAASGSGPEDRIAALRQQIRDLEAERRAIDERFQPAAALLAQTRYLLWMWQRYPSVDWVFEAYHGGEEGTVRTLRTFLGPAWKRAGSVANAILGRDRAGQKVMAPVSYESLFFAVSPRKAPAAFDYLYGLRDEHRAYWFKLLMAERALDWLRRDPRGLKREWLALRPGYPLESAWYPNLGEHAYATASDVASAARSGEIRSLPASGLTGVVVGPLMPWSGRADELAAARPEALGALKQVAQTYRQESLRPQTLQVVAMTQARSLVDEIQQRYPSPSGGLDPGAPNTGPVIDPHTAGLAVDILKPTDPWDARVLLYALSYWEDREQIYFRTESWGNVQAWRIVPNPIYRKALAGLIAAR